MKSEHKMTIYCNVLNMFIKFDLFNIAYIICK